MNNDSPKTRYRVTIESGAVVLEYTVETGSQFVAQVSAQQQAAAELSAAARENATVTRVCAL